MELTKLAPSLLYRFRVSFTPRTPTSPHQLPGRSVDGKVDDAEPWFCESQCELAVTLPSTRFCRADAAFGCAGFAHQREFFCDVEERVV